MTPIRWLTVVSAVACIGTGLALSGWLQPRPRLERALAHINDLRLNGSANAQVLGIAGPVRASEFFRDCFVEPLTQQSSIMIPDEDLRLLSRSPQQQVMMMLAAALVAGLSPAIIVGLAQILGLINLAVYVPVVVVLLGVVIGPLLVQRQSRERAAQMRTDLRYQLSAFLDVVTMLLAGNTGHEGALLRAAQAGDGRLFVELSAAMREAAAAGRSLVTGLEQTGVTLGIVELRQVASTVSLSAAEGSPVARTLAAKCATLRSTLASEQETEARLRTSRLTTPLVGMGLIFMALVIYPALRF
jgi:Flp pilus assembly protein TadB